MRAAHCLTAVLALGLGACATVPRHAPAPQPPVPPPATDAPAPTATTTPRPAAHPPPAEEQASPWQRIRDGLAMHGCNHGPETLHWAHRYTASPGRFADSWKQAMPFVLLVLDEVEKRKLPTEFVFLPYVESHYRPVAGRGDGPAGMWQLTAATARGRGVRVAADYDGRLDAIDSTRASLDLIALYEEKFGDWRLANMAFNAGEFRVAKLLDAPGERRLSRTELANLALSRTTHEHLDKLMALACVIDDPTRFGVQLPTPGPDDRLAPVALSRTIDLRVASKLAAIEPTAFGRLNAGHRRSRIGAEAPLRLLLPAQNAERFRQAADQLPAGLWADWRELRTRHATDVASLADAAGTPVAVVALANGVDDDARIADGARVLLPGRETADRPETAAAAGQTHLVRSGDTLGAIARRYGVKLAQLLRWNAIGAGAVLRPGDRILIGPP